MKRLFLSAILVTGIAVSLSSSLALAATFVSGGTIPAGTTIHAALGQAVDSRTVTVGTSFQLLIDEPTQPAIDRASIHGHITEVSQPGIDRASIGFILTNIVFANGKKEPIHAQVMNKNVTYVNTAEVKREQAKFKLPPMLPVGTVTPGPIAWQITFRPGERPSVTPPPAGNSGGYVYAANSNENIVIPAGTLVTMKLTSNLALP